MEKYLEEYCRCCVISFNKIIQQYNSNMDTCSRFINKIIAYKIENNKNIIYKEDILKIFLKTYKQNISQEEFMKNVMIDIKRYNSNINNLTVKDSFHSGYLWLYCMSTFLGHEPVDIKIALK
jgi:hypothetical protein